MPPEDLEQYGSKSGSSSHSSNSDDVPNFQSWSRLSQPLTHLLCDNTTTFFSKLINNKKQHLSKKILQCAAHLTDTVLFHA
jgi:hypothetical protein